MSSTAPKHDEEQEAKFRDEFGPDPELYEELSQPYDTKADADEALNLFLLAVKRLREECGVAEVMVLAANHFKPEGEAKETVAVRALALGSPRFHAELGALAYQQYTLPDVLRAARLARIAQGAERTGSKS